MYSRETSKSPVEIEVDGGPGMLTNGSLRK